MVRSAVRWVVGMVMVGMALGGCESAYVTPGARADFKALGMSESEKAALTDATVQRTLEKKPLVQFPAAIAVVRVQGSGYNAYAYRFNDVQRGVYSVVTNPDVETDEDFKAIAGLPKVKGVGSIKRILLDQPPKTDLELRSAAAKIHADLLLVYTFDTAFYSQNSAVPLSLISLGIFPTEVKKVRSTASALLMDVNNGYIYAVVEATASDDQLANAWSSAEAADQVRVRAERKALTAMVKQFCGQWVEVVKNYDKPAGGR